MNKLRSAGFSGVEFVAIVAAIAVGTLILLTVMSGFFSGPKTNSAAGEVVDVVYAIEAYQVINKSYLGISVSALVAGGYDIGGYTNGVNENAYGKTVSVVPAADLRSTTVEYATESSSQCMALIERLKSGGQIKSAMSCDASHTLTFDS